MTYTAKVYFDDKNTVVSNEQITVPTSITQIYLKHDNSNSITIFTGLNSTGIQITDFTVTADSISPWRIFIQFGNTAMTTYGNTIVYATYTTSGDQASADKLNSIESTLASLSTQINAISTTAGVNLSIVSVSPINNATNISASTPVSFVANKWLDDGQTSSIQVYSDSARTTTIPGTVTKTASKSYSWSPTANMNNSVLIYPKVVAGLIGVDGVTLTNDYFWSFQTAADSPPYAVDSVNVTGYSTTSATITAIKTSIPTYWDVDDPTAIITFDVYLDANITPYGNYTWAQISAGIAVTGQSWAITSSHTAKVKTKSVTGSKTEYSSGVVSSAFIIPSHQAPTYPILGTPTVGNATAIVTVTGISTFYDSATLSTYNWYKRVTGQTTWLSDGTGASPHTYSTLTNGSPGYDFCVETVDSIGGVSAKSAVVTGTPTADIIVQETDSTITYIGTWSVYTNAGSSGGALKYSGTTGNTAEYNFNGTGVAWWGRKDVDSGIAEVYIDNVSQGTIDIYSSPAVAQSKLYENLTLTSGQHTIKIRVTGTKNASSSNTNVTLDYFDITGAVTGAFIETPNNTVTGAYTDTFARVDSSTVGNSWVVGFNGAGTYSISGNKLLGNNAVAAEHLLLKGDMPNITDVAVTTKFIVGSPQRRLVARALETETTNPNYYLGIESITQNDALLLFKVVSGVATQIGTYTMGLAGTALNQTWVLKLTAQGTSIQLKAWKDGTVEPTTSQIIATDSAITRAGKTGVSIYQSTITTYNNVGCTPL